MYQHVSRTLNLYASILIAVLLTAARPGGQAPARTVTPANPTIVAGQTQQFTANGMSTPATIDAGGDHACMLMSDRSVRCFGRNQWGQLGDGHFFTNASTPVPVVGLTTAIDVGAGMEHSCSVLADGTMRCWGTRYVGQLGDGSNDGLTDVPVAVQNLTGAIAGVVGGFHTCAILSDRSMRCWGFNEDGQVGNGATAFSANVPQAVVGVGGPVSAATAGGYHTCALLPDSTVRCWGRNTRGQLGNGTSISSSTPVAVSGLTNVAAVSGGGYHTCALRRDGTVQCWGENDRGQIGNTLAFSNVPVTVAGISTAVAISTGFLHSCAILADGTTRCWGHNNTGQLGNGTTTNSSSPVPVTGLSGPMQIAAGGTFDEGHSCVMMPDRRAKCWGDNAFGQLGNGTTTDSGSPVNVSGTGGLTWTSSHPAVATIDAAGLATGVGAGTTTITATDGSGSASTTLTVTQPTTRVTLSTIRQGSGTGTISSNPAGIACGTDCTEDYDSGTTVTLTAAPGSGSVFAGWSGGCSGTQTCTITLTANTTVSATFATAGISAPVLQWQYGGCLSGPYCQRGWYSSPAVTDLDGDGQQDVLWGANDVVALNGSTGGLKWRAPGSTRVWPGIAVADLTNDGTTEVIVARNNDRLTVYDRFGNATWTRNPFGSGELRTLAVADLENDGQQDIIVGTASWSSPYQLSVFKPDGTVRAGWPARHSGEPGYGSGLWNANAAVADMQGDGVKEVFTTTGSHYITALASNGSQLGVNGTYSPRAVWSEVGVAVDQSAESRGWVNCGVEHRPNFGESAPVITDVDGNGIAEFIVIGSVHNCATNPYTYLFHIPFIFNLDRTRWAANGFDWQSVPLPGAGSAPWSQDYNVIELIAANAVVADLDGDGLKEILYPSYDGRVHAFWLDKTEHGNWPYRVPSTGAGGDDYRYASEPVVVDLNNDGRAEVIFTSWPKKATGGTGQLIIVDHQGNELHRVSLPAPSIGNSWNGALGAPTVANVDADPDLEVIVGTVWSGVVTYSLPNTANARVLWGTGRGNFLRNGS